MGRFLNDIEDERGRVGIRFIWDSWEDSEFNFNYVENEMLVKFYCRFD